MMSHWPYSLLVNFIILRVDLTWLYIYEHYMLLVDLTRLCVISIYHTFLSCTTLYKWLSLLVYVFDMHNFLQMTIHIIFDFCHAHLCTNDYSYYFWILSCTSLSEWLSILFLVFIMHISVRITIHIIIGFCHAHLCTNDHT